MGTAMMSTRGEVVRMRPAGELGEPRTMLVEPVDSEGPAPTIAITPGALVEVLALMGNCDVLTSARDMRRVAGILLGAAELVESLES